MSEDDEQTEATEPPSEKVRTKKIVRRLGYVAFLGGGFAIFVAMLIGVVNGIRADRAWNPYTGLPQTEGRCQKEARELMLDAGELDRLNPPWVGRYREWVTRCKDGHEELFEVLRNTHSDLQKLSKDDD